MAVWTEGSVMKNTEGKVMGSEYEAGETNQEGVFTVKS
jgi:hypothetical protein